MKNLLTPCLPFWLLFLLFPLRKKTIKIAGDTALANRLVFEARNLQKVNEFDSALVILDQSKAIFSSINDSNSVDYGSLMHEYGQVFLTQSLLDSAHYYYSEAIRIRKKRLGDMDLSLAISLNNKSRCYFFQGRYNEAILLLEEVVKIRRAKLPPKDSLFIYFVEQFSLL
ncbi:MAG: tetratricopeptide repeat protein [Saprospiraceae bacterium]|nr:tetratricopeptide repeat protein [Saprospiraceae bacterium]